MKRCRRRKGASRERSRRAPGLEAIIRSKRTGARRPCPVVAKRPAGSVFEPMKGSTMNALTKTTEHQARSRKMYTGRRGPQGCVVCVIAGNGERKPLNPRQELRNHSPTGFEWGYGGSGPAQLALAILAEHLGNDDAAVIPIRISSGHALRRYAAPTGRCPARRSTIASLDYRNSKRTLSP